MSTIKVNRVEPFSGSTVTVVGLDLGSASVDWDLVYDKPEGLVSGSSQLTSSYDERYVLSGSVGAADWDTLLNRPVGILSSSQQIASDISGAFVQTSQSIAGDINGIDNRLDSLEVESGSVRTTLNSFTQSQNNLNQTFATTGSNVFQANQTINGNLSVSGSFTASGFTYPTTDGIFGVEFVGTDANGNLTLEIPETIYEEVKNDDIVTLPKGTPVKVTGYQGNQALVVKADAGNPALMPATYILAQELDPQDEGLGIILGRINNINTLGLTAGEVVYVGVGGGFTQQRPTGSAEVQPLGIPVRINENGSGIVLNPGVSNDLPNLPKGELWVGDGDSVPTTITTSSFAKVGVNNTFTGLQTFNNIAVNGTGSFAYIQSVTGSAKIIGDAFIILNTAEPPLRYAGIKVEDSGSATTASLFYDSEVDHWGYESVDNYQAAFLTSVTSSVGSFQYPTVNKVLKSLGETYVGDSNIEDNGNKVQITTELSVTSDITASGIVKGIGGFDGNLSGNASTATSASHALQSDNSTLFDNKNSAQFATTGSNTFIGNQIVSGTISTDNNLSVKEYTLGTNTYPQNVFLNTTGIPNISSVGRLAFTEIINGGSGYTPGTYNGVVVEYVSGPDIISLANVNVIVNSSGVVASVTVPAGQNTILNSYDTVLTVNASNIGGTGSGFEFKPLILQGFENILFGVDSGKSITTAPSTIAIGNQTLQSLTTGTNNIGIGNRALKSVTTSNTNIAIGNTALESTTASNGIAIGNQALRKNTTGTSNIGIGSSALSQNTTGTSNIGLGTGVLATNTTGGSNISIGSTSLSSLVTGSQNISIGSTTFQLLATGSDNIAIGHLAGRNTSVGVLTQSTGSIFIGRSAGSQGNNTENEIVIGDNLKGNGPNTTTIGNANTTTTYIGGVLNTGINSGSINYIEGTVKTRRIHFAKNPFNNDIGGNLGAIRLDDNNKRFYITNYDTAEISSQSMVILNVDTASNLINTELNSIYNGTSANLDLRNENGDRYLLINVDDVQITGSLSVSETFTASLEAGYVWVGNGNNRTTTITTSSFATTTSNTFNGNQTITGSLSVSGSINTSTYLLQISSNTASLDASVGNTFQLNLTSGSTTRLEVSNQKEGQTINLLVSQSSDGTGSLVLGNNIYEPTGSEYTPTAKTSAEDILTLATFVNPNKIYMVNVKELV